jgi:hypothetical protein
MNIQLHLLLRLEMLRSLFLLLSLQFGVTRKHKENFTTIV